MTEETTYYYEGVGRRKTSTARVRIYPGGDGTVLVNDRSLDEYFPRPGDIATLIEPLKLTDNEGRVNVTVHVKGGGQTGQTDAVRHGISRALVKMDPELRIVLRKGGYLSRDAREKERKKPGLKRARKAPTYTKR
ncbi:MAG: 30S ribosomal protein S9 [Anaerolineales bacterium]|nr:30S ribosomal protein S9 [Anaerolineales bacterium]